MKDTCDVGQELFLRKRSLHYVANKATRQNVSGYVTLIVPNPVNTREFKSSHFSPLSISAKFVGWWLTAIRAVLLNYFVHLFKRESECVASLLCSPAIFIEDPRCSRIGVVASRPSTAIHGIPAFRSVAATLGLLQSVFRKGLFGPASAAHSPVNHPTLNPASSGKSLLPYNRKMPVLFARNIDKFHAKLLHVGANQSLFLINKVAA